MLAVLLLALGIRVVGEGGVAERVRAGLHPDVVGLAGDASGSGSVNAVPCAYCGISCLLMYGALELP